MQWLSALSACISRLQRRMNSSTNPGSTGIGRPSNGDQTTGRSSSGSRNRLTLAQASHALLAVKQAGLACPALVDVALDRFEDSRGSGKATKRGPPPEASATLAVALVQGMRQHGVFAESRALELIRGGMLASPDSGSVA